MIHGRPCVVVSDTSILVNFLRIDRMDLFAGHPSDFIVTDHVAGEITDDYPDQQARFISALAHGAIRQVSVTEPEALKLFGTLAATGRLGAGECSAIALAVRCGHMLAIEDKRAIRQAQRVSHDLTILKTQDVVVSMVREGLLDVPAADAIKDLWAAEHRFRLGFDSFAELLES